MWRCQHLLSAMPALALGGASVALLAVHSCRGGKVHIQPHSFQCWHLYQARTGCSWPTPWSLKPPMWVLCRSNMSALSNFGTTIRSPTNSIPHLPLVFYIFGQLAYDDRFDDQVLTLDRTHPLLLRPPLFTFLAAFLQTLAQWLMPPHLAHLPNAGHFLAPGRRFFPTVITGLLDASLLARTLCLGLCLCKPCLKPRFGVSWLWQSSPAWL